MTLSHMPSPGHCERSVDGDIQDASSVASARVAALASTPAAAASWIAAVSAAPAASSAAAVSMWFPHPLHPQPAQRVRVMCAFGGSYSRSYNAFALM